MPNFDGTGPRGQGSMTGRGMGKCKETDNKTVARPRVGRGFGLGLGMGMGRRRTGNKNQQ